MILLFVAGARLDHMSEDGRALEHTVVRVLENV